MVSYELTVYTGKEASAITVNSIYIKLVGTKGESDRKWLNILPIFWGSEVTYCVDCEHTLGQLILIEVDKRTWFLSDAWLPEKVEITTPEGDVYTFPVYCWISDSETHRFREGKALKIYEEENPLGLYARKQELLQRRKEYRWDEYDSRLPRTIKADGVGGLPDKNKFSWTKTIQFYITGFYGKIGNCLKKLTENRNNWKNLDEIHNVLSCRTSNLYDYIRQHWKEDDFFGYQYLNGINPILIRRCKTLPPNFPVTDDMVFFPEGLKLSNELGQGNIYLCDYKNLDGLPANTVLGKQQYLTAPLVLFHKRPDDKLMPIAIQLKQTPGEDNPIFLPTDSTHDWLTAKIFVRNADFTELQLNTHLLRTHLLAEAFAVSLQRNLPMVHPLYKLLIPHTRYTLQINTIGRGGLIGPTGLVALNAGSGGKATTQFMAKSMSDITYTSLCIPDDINERDMHDVPNYYYRDDGLKIWYTMYKFVQGVLEYYYKCDDDVLGDSELQTYIGDIFKNGFLSNTEGGFPQSFTTVTEMVKFVTMVMFTCSCQHAAVNNGMFDYAGWMPNLPPTMQCPPPTEKGTTTEATILATLPPVCVTAESKTTVWLLSRPPSDFVTLGHYPEDHFTEETPRQLQRKFKVELEVLTTDFKMRNMDMEIPYTYLIPNSVENSITI
ncbi:arachidonate 12-lipoxygenase, 12R-type-like [Entelurus aequoreus]|uniref:arachidonate 12-lipoxygenase, 12R-type-like n=1 Tax=Entelurus aequoreus TaxID=161455 RepID=UPI002B1DE510|nr:arachidonate 12-lipoxygenase, 12R-type-like [Entelurus aequoreus]